LRSRSEIADLELRGVGERCRIEVGTETLSPQGVGANAPTSVAAVCRPLEVVTMKEWLPLADGGSRLTMWPAGRRRFPAEAV